MALAQLPHLSPREDQISALVAAGKTNEEIAAMLKIAAGTVKEHLRRIFQKFGCHRRTELAVQYVQGASVKPSRANPSITTRREMRTKA